MVDRSQDRISPETEQLFADWLAGLEGERADISSLCREHPAHAQALQVLFADWQRLRGVLSRAGLTDLAARENRLAQRLEARFGSDVDPRVSLGRGEPQAGQAPTSGLLKRLSERGQERSRYRVSGEIARGGMGAILEVWDDDLRRRLAMKVILGREPESPADISSVDRRVLTRFLEEAQVTAQLDHPGIVPVHELGLDAQGRVYFTMKLVKGRDLSEILELVFAAQEGWSESRALTVLLKVCDALSYAHSKGVIHRDLKPANVMVGDFGEVYVMDWGLARVQGRADSHDIRLAPDSGAPSRLRTIRQEERTGTPDSPLFTMDGDVVGTPAYMPPEQARGEIERLSARSDVYAIGAMLYHLLARQMPYVPPGARLTNRTVLLRLLGGPPDPLQSLRPGIPAELAAICEKAMAREPERRYRDTLELAQDLSAFLEGRVVRAFESGTWAAARKWVKRNRMTAAALALTAGVVLFGGSGASVVLAGKNRTIARERDQALSAVHEAELQRAGADRVVEYLVALFEAADPAEHLGSPPGVKDLLDRGRADIEALAVEPRVQARLLTALGLSYEAMGQFAPAQELLERALALLETSPGSERELLRAAGHLGALHNDRGPYERALELNLRCYKGLRALAGERDLDTLRGMTNLAISYDLSGRASEAIELHERVLALRQELGGPDDRETLTTLANLALLYRNAGRWEEAEGLQRRISAVRGKKLGELHPETARDLSNHAVTLAQGQRYQEASELFERAYTIQRRVLGEDHADTLRSLNNIGVLHHLQGELETALDWYRRALAKCAALLGPDDPDTLRTRHNLGEVLKDLGRLAEARPELEAAFEGRKQHLGPDQPDTLETERVLVDLLSLLGEHDQASALVEDLIGRTTDAALRAEVEELADRVLERAGR